MIKKAERLALDRRYNRIQTRGAPLYALSKTLREQVKVMKFQIHNMLLLAKQADDYARDWELLGKEEEPTYKWIIDAGLYQKF